MQTMGLFNAKTHLSRIVDDLLSGKEDRVVISRHGKPAVVVTPIENNTPSSRIGIARGLFDVPADIDGSNPQIADLFDTKTSS